jgi:hypothetical protein
MSYSLQTNSKRTIIQWVLGIVMALPTFFPEHIGASSLFSFPVLLVLPGMLIAMALSGNVHAYPPLLATAVNAVF